MKGDVKGSLVPSRLSLLVFGVEDYNGLFNEGDDGKEEGRRERQRLPSSRLPIFPARITQALP